MVFSQTTVFASSDALINDSINDKTIKEKYKGIIPANLAPDGFNINQSYYNSSLNAYVDPIFAQINDMRAKGITDDRIVAELKKQDITFNPKMNEWAKGIPVTPPKIINPYSGITIQNGMSLLSDTRTQINSYHNTYSYTYSGFSNTLYPGNMELYGDGYTFYNYLTTHIGNSAHWTEAGIAHWTSGYYVFTYDNLFSPNQWYTVATSPGTAHDVNILIWNIYDEGQGYVYTVTLDGNMVRSGHLSSYSYQVTQNNEVGKSATDPTFTTNAYSNLVYNQHLFRLNSMGQHDNLLWNENAIITLDGDGGSPSHQYVSTDSCGSTQVYTWIDY